MIGRTAVLLLALGLTAGPGLGATPQAGVLGGFRLWDSGLYPVPSPEPVQWLDEDTIVLRGDLSGKPDSATTALHRETHIVLWHLGEPPVLQDDPRWAESRMALLCAADGELVYSIGLDSPKPGTSVMRVAAGPPGELRERTLPVDERGATHKIQGLHPVGRIVGLRPSCDPVSDPRMQGQVWATDAAGRYYLEFGDLGHARAGTDIVLQPQGGAVTPTSLDLTGHDVDAACTQYATFTGLFYLRRCNGFRQAARDPTACPGFWTVTPATGRLEQHCLTADDWLARADIDLAPTRQFVTFATQAGITRDDVGEAGLYAILSGRTRRLIAGILGPLAVSPSGCRLAFSYARTPDDMAFGTPGRHSIIAIDLCRPVGAGG
jgi:hypothetical protein